MTMFSSEWFAAGARRGRNRNSPQSDADVIISPFRSKSGVGAARKPPARHPTLSHARRRRAPSHGNILSSKRQLEPNSYGEACTSHCRAQVGRGQTSRGPCLPPSRTVQRCRAPACPLVRPLLRHALHRICDRLTFTAGLSAGIVSYNRDGPVRRRMRFGRRQVVDADLRIYVQEVRAVHTASANGGMRLAVRLPGMRHGCPPCPPDRTTLPHHVGRSASGRRKVRAQHRRIARPAAILARSCWNDQEVETCPEAETCTDESVSARLTDLASRDPANFPQVDPFFAVRSMAPVAARTRLPVRRADGRRAAAVGER
jgi:hypothetical protein